MLPQYLYNFAICNLYKSVFIHFVVLLLFFLAVMSNIAFVDAPVKIIVGSNCFFYRLFNFYA